MTNNTLSHVLRSIDISKGHLVKSVGNLDAILIENHTTRIVNLNGKFSDVYDYLVLLKDGKKAGIMLKCGSIDIHAYVFRKYRDQHIVSKLTGDKFLRKIWPDITTITCCNMEEKKRIEHLAKIAGLEIRK